LADRVCIVRAIPALVLLSAAVCLGVIMGIQYLRHVRSKPVMIGIHLLLGAGGLEVLAMMLRGAPDGSTIHGRSVAVAAAGLLALALMAGIAAPMIGRRSRRTMSVALATHAGIAAAGFLVLLAWAIGTP
jgi:hypothetical protein